MHHDREAGMTDRLSYAELSEIFEGAANSRRQFIADHRRREDRPDTWFHQQERELRAFMQAQQDYRRAASREDAA